eukprot:scaffold31514_cov212-Skeletonema_marinoi.AAC.1
MVFAAQRSSGVASLLNSTSTACRMKEYTVFDAREESPLRTRGCRSGISLPEEEARFASLFSKR